MQPGDPGGVTREEELARRWLRLLRIAGIALAVLVAVIVAVELVLWLTWGGLEPFGKSGG